LRRLFGRHVAIGRTGARTEAGQQPARLLHVAAPLLAQVRLLARVAREVVQLGQRQLDVLLAAVDDAGQRRPAAIDRYGKRLEVRVAIADLAEERVAGERFRLGDAGG